MDEGSKDELLKNNLPVKQFNEIAKAAIGKRNEPKISVGGVMDAEEQIKVENWLAQPETQDFFKRLEQDKRQTLGVVWEVRNVEEQIHVGYIDQFGMKLGFVYSPGKPMFADAPNGFKVGDIILNKFSQGVTFESIKPITFSGKTENKVVRRFKQILENEIRKGATPGEKPPKEIGEEEKEE